MDTRAKNKAVPSCATETSEQFIASSIIRFGRLQHYIQEKIFIDYFAIKGNFMMAEGLREYIKNNIKDLKALDKINLLDVGPAIGAVSTLICLQTLNDFGLLEKTRVYFIDVSEKVIDSTQRGDFSYPETILDLKLKGRMMKKLRESRAIVGSAEKLPWKNDYFRIVLAGFLFHHLHDDIKPAVASEMARTLAPNGFLGIAEEWFKNYENDYACIHKNDQIPLAYESIITPKKLQKLFPKFRFFFSIEKTRKENFYVLCGIKNL
jgi:SAM-dependent methyltransferase